MPKIAVIQFPGFNCEYETRRAIRAAGMECDFFRWNEDPKKLESYDGFVLPGGFSYEDRGRAGLIAALDPAMDALIAETEKGKPLLGICNGAQVLMETGMVPGAPDRNLLMSLARNKRIKEGRILGTGFYNVWAHVMASAPAKRTPFTTNIQQNQIYKVPVAHGEGRYTTTHPDLLNELIENNQITFRYCDADGKISEEFPINPNGALYNMAALCNPAGNVMGIMPHPERGFSSPIEACFDSMSSWFKDQHLHRNLKLNAHSDPVFPKENYEHPKNTLEFFIELIITDNEAETLQSTLSRRGFDNIKLRRYVHYEVHYNEVTDRNAFIKEIESSGELFNPNKEMAAIFGDDDARPAHNETQATFAILVRDREDFAGQSKAYNLRHHLHDEKHIGDVKRGTLWTVTFTNTKSTEKDQARDKFNQILSTNIFYNHHAQTVVWY